MWRKGAALPVVGDRRPERISVLLVEDDGLLRDALRIALSQAGPIDVVGAFADGDAALQAAPHLDFQVAVLDIVLGHGPNGVQVGRLLRRQRPHLGIVLLSHHSDAAVLGAVPESELAGWSFLLKASVGDVAALRRAVEGTAAGFVVLDPRLVVRRRAREEGLLRQLPPRQREVLGLVAQGFSNTAIAEEMGVTVKTVENQLNGAYRTIGIDPDDGSVQPRVTAVLTYLRETRG